MTGKKKYFIICLPRSKDKFFTTRNTNNKNHFFSAVIQLWTEHKKPENTHTVSRNEDESHIFRTVTKSNDSWSWIHGGPGND